jgi:hypothetical protein
MVLSKQTKAGFGIQPKNQFINLIVKLTESAYLIFKAFLFKIFSSSGLIFLPAS